MPLSPGITKRDLAGVLARRRTEREERGRDHNDPQPAEYYQVLAAFLDRLP